MTAKLLQTLDGKKTKIAWNFQDKWQPKELGNIIPMTFLQHKHLKFVQVKNCMCQLHHHNPELHYEEHGLHPLVFMASCFSSSHASLNSRLEHMYCACDVFLNRLALTQAGSWKHVQQFITYQWRFISFGSILSYVLLESQGTFPQALDEVLETVIFSYQGCNSKLHYATVLQGSL